MASPKKKTTPEAPPEQQPPPPPDGAGAPPPAVDADGNPITPPDPGTPAAPNPTPDEAAKAIAALNLPVRATAAKKKAEAAGDDEPRVEGAPGANDAPLVDEDPPDPTIENTDPAPGVFVGHGISGIQRGDDVWLVDPDTGVITGKG